MTQKTQNVQKQIGKGKGKDSIRKDDPKKGKWKRDHNDRKGSPKKGKGTTPDCHSGNLKNNCYHYH